MNNLSLGFIGAGHLNRALLFGLLSDFEENHHHQEREEPKFLREKIFISSKNQKSASELSQELGINLGKNNAEVVKNSQIIFLGVRPNQLGEVFSDLANLDLSEKIIITLAAGVKLENYRRCLGQEPILIRAMPNLAVELKASTTGLFCDEELDDETGALIEDIFAELGSVVWLDDETQVDGITALSGTGIALFFRFMEAMAKEGERFGFDKDEIYAIVALTANSASNLATFAMENNQGNDFSSFIKTVATKGGTTEAALLALNPELLDKSVANALSAAIEKCRKLGDKIAEEL